MRPTTRFGRRRPASGVNVVGYFDAASGLGERARELAACLRSAGVDVTEWPIPDAPGHDAGAIVRRATIAVVTAVQLASVRERVPAPFERARTTIGYFFWELADVPEEQQWGIGLVDEIWTPTEFVRAAYADATDRPVRLVPVPIPEPIVGAGQERRPTGPFTFLTSFDHRSVMARKHPIGAVRAFRRAFPDGDEPVALVVKSIHGDERPDAVARLEAAIGDDTRISLRDGVIDERAQHELIARADAFVSLHRSEGLGLHLAEAMWLGTPVIATGYSGNLDLMDESCAALVDHRMVTVGDGDGAYPESSWWAEPDLDHAAALMRRMVDDIRWRTGLAAAASARMAAQPSRTATGAAISRLLARPA